MNAQSKLVPTIEDERGARRQTLIWKGVLHHDNQSTDVRVRNISTSGAMIESPIPLRVGSEPVLQLSDNVSISATVEWTVDEHMGVSFREPFDLALLAQVRPVVTRPTWAPPDSAVQAAWDRRLRRLSPAQLRAEFKGYIRD
jgi:PilZ domain